MYAIHHQILRKIHHELSVGPGPTNPDACAHQETQLLWPSEPRAVLIWWSGIAWSLLAVGLKGSALNLAATQRDNMRVLALLLGFAAVQAAAVRGKEQLSENPIRRIVNLLQMMAKEVEADGEKDEEMTEKCGGFDVIVFRSVSFG